MSATRGSRRRATSRGASHRRSRGRGSPERTELACPLKNRIGRYGITRADAPTSGSVFTDTVRNCESCARSGASRNARDFPKKSPLSCEALELCAEVVGARLRVRTTGATRISFQDSQLRYVSRNRFGLWTVQPTRDGLRPVLQNTLHSSPDTSLDHSHTPTSNRFFKGLSLDAGGSRPRPRRRAYPPPTVSIRGSFKNSQLKPRVSTVSDSVALDGEFQLQDTHRSTNRVPLQEEGGGRGIEKFQTHSGASRAAFHVSDRTHTRERESLVYTLFTTRSPTPHA